MDCNDVRPGVDMGLRDPRLWSNLRGVIGGEGASARVAAYSRISCREGMTVTEAWAEGFTRHGAWASRVDDARSVSRGGARIPGRLGVCRPSSRPSSLEPGVGVFRANA